MTMMSSIPIVASSISPEPANAWDAAAMKIHVGQRPLLAIGSAR